MPTFVDLLWQVKNLLPIRSGGTGNDQGAARTMLMLQYMNDTGGAIALGTLVKLHGSSHDDLRVIPTTTASELGVLGVVVGRFTAGDGLSQFEAVAPAHQESVAVCIAGRCRVLVEAAVTQGQYAYVAATDGKAAGSSSPIIGSIGRFEGDGTTSALVVLASGGGTAAITAPEDVAHLGTVVVDSFQTLDFGDSFHVHDYGTTAGIEVDPTNLELMAEQVEVEDTGAYFTTPSPGSGTVTLRPTSDVAQTAAGSIVFSSGSVGWSLVDESSLNTGDYYAGSNNGTTPWYMIHGYPATALDISKRIASVILYRNGSHAIGTSDGNFYVRNPQTGEVLNVNSYNPGGTQPESYTMTTRPWDSLPWTLDDVDNLEAGVGQANGGGNGMIAYQVYVEVNWTAPKTVESVLAEIGAAGAGGSEILDHTTTEMDDTLVLAPDGAGNVEFRAETAGSGLITKDEGSTVGTATTMDFVGSGVSASYSGGTTTVTIAGGGGNYTGNPWSSGTSFPGSPSTGDRVTRTDRGLDFFYNGTRWLTTTLYKQTVSYLNVTYPAPALNATTGAVKRDVTPALEGNSDVWLEDWNVTFYIAGGGTALGASHKWVGTLKSGRDATNNTLDTIGTANVDSGSSGQIRRVTATIDALLNNGTVHDWFQTDWAKTGTPGDIQMYEEVSYRLVG